MLLLRWALRLVNRSLSMLAQTSPQADRWGGGGGGGCSCAAWAAVAPAQPCQGSAAVPPSSPEQPRVLEQQVTAPGPHGKVLECGTKALPAAGGATVRGRLPRGPGKHPGCVRWAGSAASPQQRQPSASTHLLRIPEAQCPAPCVGRASSQGHVPLGGEGEDDRHVGGGLPSPHRRLHGAPDDRGVRPCAVPGAQGGIKCVCVWWGGGRGRGRGGRRTQGVAPESEQNCQRAAQPGRQGCLVEYNRVAYSCQHTTPRRATRGARGRAHP